MSAIIIRTEQDKKRAIQYLTDLSIEKPLKITITSHRKNRTLAQNRLAHKWFNCIAEHWLLTTGEAFSAMAWKEQLKRMFLGFDEFELPNGAFIHNTKRTRDCTTKELTDFLEKVEAYCLIELNLQLPRPEDIYFEAMGYTVKK